MTKFLQKYLYYYSLSGSLTRFLVRFGGTLYDDHCEIIPEKQS